LVAANALEANSNANPITTLFDTVANFMTAPFLSRNRVGKRLGRPGSRRTRENLCVLPRIAYNAAVGVKQASRKACLRIGGFLTWAAKPKVRESPNPAEKFTIATRLNLSRLIALFYPVRNANSKSSMVSKLS
jgi:hypothetical protein